MIKLALALAFVGVFTLAGIWFFNLMVGGKNKKEEQNNQNQTNKNNE